VSDDAPPSPPRAGVDYPRTLLEFCEFFPDEKACEAYLERLRWAEGFVCPKGHAAATPWRSDRGLSVCPTCRCQVSATAGTIFEGTRKLRHWFLAAWEVTNQKYGANALGIQRSLGLGSYETAWAWLHKLRRAMVRPDRDQLSGEVEVDETYLGAEEPGGGSTGRRVIHRAIVAIAVEVNVGKIGRVRLRQVPNVNKTSLQGFIVDAVKPGSLIHTDGWQGYAKIADKGFRHRVTVTRTSSEPAHIPFPGVHRVASLLKRWCLGTLQGGYSTEHLPYYLDELTFRFNRRTSKVRGLLFYRLVSQAARSPHISTDALSQATGRGRRPTKEANHHG
jgi:transposase-like protein